MENKNKFPQNEVNEYVVVYPPIKEINDLTDTKQFLALFSRIPRRSSILNPQMKDFLKIQNLNSNNLINSQKEPEKSKEQNKNKDQEKNETEKYNCFLINKDINLRKNKLKRSTDIKNALEIFLRKSDLIEKITKYFEEFRENLMNIKKSKMMKKDNKKEGEKVEEENEKFIELYIESILSKLADNVIIEKYSKNQFIMKMNDIGDSCYFLLSGKLSVLKPVEYHIEITYDDYMQYIANLMKYNEQELIETIRHLNQHFIDVGLVEDMPDLVKSYFIIKLNKDINNLFDNDNFDLSFIEKRLKLFNLSFEDFDLSLEQINSQIDIINKGSIVKEKELKNYFDKITTPKQEDFKRLETNPNIFNEGKHKVTIFKYEDFLYLKPGAFFGETALDSTTGKRNASIRSEEECYILSLKNEIYQSLLSESNKRLKSFDVIFICKNFFFNDISPIIFNRRYFSMFKLINKSKDDIIYKQNNQLSSVYFIKEGNVKLEINISVFEIYNLIKKYFEILTSNPNLKINQNELKEIKEVYLDDKNITNVRRQSHIFKEQLKIKKKFELYSSNLFDTLGLEEFFLNNDYLCTCKVISKEAKIFEISFDSLNIIITSEKQIHKAFYNLILRKLISLIKRLHVIKKNYITQLNYRIKENFFGTEVPKDRLIKGQTGDGKPFSKANRKKSEPKVIRTYGNKSEKEEIKFDFFPFNKINLKYHTRNSNFWNQDFNTLNIKNKENLTYDNFKNYFKKKEKENNIKLQNKQNNNSISKKAADKNDGTTLTSNTEQNNLLSTTQMIKIDGPNEVQRNSERTNRIMETTIIKVGKDHLTLKDIGNRLKNNNIINNSELSIVKNFYYKTYSNIKNTSFTNNNSLEKKNELNLNKTQKNYSLGNNIRNNFNIKMEPLSLKNNIFSKASKGKNLYNNHLPHLPINTYNNFSNMLIKSNLSHYNKFNLQNRLRGNIFKSTKIVNKNYRQNNYNRIYLDNNKSNFNVILTNDSNPILKERIKHNKKKK